MDLNLLRTEERISISGTLLDTFRVLVRWVRQKGRKSHRSAAESRMSFRIGMVTSLGIIFEQVAGSLLKNDGLDYAKVESDSVR